MSAACKPSLEQVPPDRGGVDRTRPPAHEAHWLRVCHSTDIPARRGRKVHVAGVDVALFRTSHGALFALEDRCPHRGGPLSEGLIADHCVICPLHGWKIDLITGGAAAPDKGRVQTIPAYEEEGHVYIHVPIPGSDTPLKPLEEMTGVHADSKRARIGRRRATREDFTLHDFERPIPVLAVEPPSPDDEASLRLQLSRRDGSGMHLRLDELRQRYPIVEVPSYVTCLMFGFSRDVRWLGVRLRHVLRDLGDEGFSFASFYSWETSQTAEQQRFFETLRRDQALDPRTLLVFGMNEGPLPKEHGGPLRLVVPFLQGYKSVKWLTWIKLTDADEIGYKKLNGFIEFPEFVPPDDWRPSWEGKP